MKFRDKQDAQAFVIEVGQLDLISRVDAKHSPSDEMLELFLKSRRKLVPRLKNFRKSQMTKGQWRDKRFEMMKGIKTFHRSTEGKRFHRNLSRFIVSRDTFSSGLFKRESYDPHLLEDVSSFLKSLSSLKTHYYIEHEYYHPLEEEVDFLIFGEGFLPMIERVEKSILGSGECTSEDIDFLIKLIEPKAIITEIAQYLSVPTDDVEAVVKKLKAKNPDMTFEIMWDKDMIRSVCEATGQIRSFADQSGKTEAGVEKIWSETRDDLLKQGKKEGDDSFFPILVSIVKKKLKI